LRVATVAGRSADATGPAPPEITVVIGTYNGSATLGAALAALDEQADSVPFEVIVVDDASTDATDVVASQHPGVRVIRLARNRGHGHTLNVGLEAARGRIIALTDDDCVPPPTWIRDLARAWSDAPDSVSIVGGSVRPLQTNTLNRRYVAYREPLAPQESELHEQRRFWYRLRYAILPPPPKAGRRAVYYPVGANMSLRADAARTAGGFTERRGAGEEESIARPLRDRFGAHTVWFDPGVEMLHDFGPGIGDSLRRARSYGRAHGRDWRLDGGVPTLRPLPLIAMLGSLVVATVSPLLAWAALALSPFALYRRWTRRALWGAGAETLAYPYVQLLEECADLMGFAQGALTTRRSAGDGNEGKPPIEGPQTTT
jgi:GT2 family glycosyltransferase